MINVFCGINVSSKNLEALVRFYTDVLGRKDGLKEGIKIGQKTVIFKKSATVLE